MLRLKLFLFFILIVVSLHGNELSIEHIGLDKGLNQITVFSLYQDENGCIWIGTNDGIMYYYGHSVESLTTPSSNPALTSGIVSTICGDRKGKIFALVNNRIVEYDIRTEQLKPLAVPGELTKKRITAIFYGKSGLWIGAENTIYVANDKGVNLYTELSESYTISALCEVSYGPLVVGTIESGVISYNDREVRRQLIPNSTAVNTILEDSKQNIWVGSSEKGLYKIDRNLSISHYLVTNGLSNNAVRSVCEDGNGQIWVGTFTGLNRLDPSTNVIQRFGNTDSKRQSLSSQSVRSIIKDNQGTIWIGTYFGGINYFNPNPDIYRYYNFQTSQNDFTYPIIGQIIQDIRDDFWICSDGKGLIRFNRKSDDYRFYTTANSGISGMSLKCISYDKNRDLLWIGTYRNGLNRLDIKQNKFTHFAIGGADSTIPLEWTESVQTMVRYKNLLFLGTIYGIFKFDIDTGKSTHLVLNKSVRDLIVKDDQLWIAYQDGLVCYDLVTNKIVKEYNQYDKTTALPQNRITKLLFDDRNRLWAGTDGGGLCLLNEDKASFTVFNKENSSIESDNISSIFKSREGMILIGTNKGFSRLNPESLKFDNFNTSNGFPLQSLSYGSISVTNNNELVMGGLDGMTIFREESLSTKGVDYSMRFTDLWVNNIKVKPGDDTGILKQSMVYTNKIRLKSNHKTISIAFATDNFIKSNQTEFQYKLDGFDKKWLTLSAGSMIGYMNLPAGKYTLLVKKQNQEVVDEVISLGIRVLPPVYLAWYAYLFYITFIVGFSIWVFAFYRSRLLLTTSLEFERRDKEQKELVSQAKLKFFTNVSHEFRTPLTLILGQLEMLMQSEKIASSVYKSIVHVHSNALKLNNLINELLDFRKQEQGFKKLKVSNHNFVTYLEEIVLSFQEFARFHKIELSFHSESDSVNLWFDYNELQKVFFNLISNAFKYTPEGGRILISIEVYTDKLLVSVSDSGRGIPEDMLDKIFERFYQVDDEPLNGQFNKGTGIGLALAKGIVELHSGKIYARSFPQQGSIFYVELQFGNQHFMNGKAELIDSVENVENYNQQLLLDNEFVEAVADKQQSFFSTKPTVLIVEDNEELRGILVRIFSAIYNVLEAANGKQGLAIAKDKNPELIISDVMMPEMDGTELCATLKSNFETSHIPVVLLTAQSSPEQNIAGLQRGADDYITKPFNVRLLVTRCNNLLLSRKMLQEKFSKQIDTHPLTIASNKLDQDFIEKVIAVIESNLSNYNLDVNFLCSEMAIGRRVFFYKMKSITGETPNEFIQNIRLKHAASMLLNHPEKSISEVSDELGYSSVNYFSKCFNQKFGSNPSTFRKNQQQVD